MKNEELIKIFKTDILDLIYNFKPDAWKYLSEEQQRVLMEQRNKIIEMIK